MISWLDSCPSTHRLLRKLVAGLAGSSSLADKGSWLYDWDWSFVKALFPSRDPRLRFTARICFMPNDLNELYFQGIKFYRSHYSILQVQTLQCNTFVIYRASTKTVSDKTCYGTILNSDRLFPDIIYEHARIIHFRDT